MSVISWKLSGFTFTPTQMLCAILLLVLAEISFGQDSITATARYREHQVMMNAVKSSEVGDNSSFIRRQVQKELRQIPNLGPVTFTDSTKLAVGENISEGYSKSTVVINLNGTGKVTIQACEDRDTTNVYTSFEVRYAILSKPFEIDILDGRVDSKADHDPSLTVTERRAVAASPAVTILRFEQYLKRAQHRDSDLRDLIEKSLDYYLASVWIKEASLVTDSTWVESGVAHRVSQYLAIGGLFESSLANELHTIKIAIHAEGDNIQRIRYTISTDIQPPDPAKAAFPQIALSGEALGVLEIERE